MATKEKEAKKNQGKTLGLNVRGTWVKLLTDNEKAPRGKKMTDTEISKFMNKEFPGRDAFDFQGDKGVQRVRSAYNSGFFTQGEVPDVLSNKYNEEGEKITAWGKPLSAIESKQKGSKKKIESKSVSQKRGSGPKKISKSGRGSSGRTASTQQTPELVGT